LVKHFHQLESESFPEIQTEISDFLLFITTIPSIIHRTRGTNRMTISESIWSFTLNMTRLIRYDEQNNWRKRAFSIVFPRTLGGGDENKRTAVEDASFPRDQSKWTQKFICHDISHLPPNIFTGRTSAYAEIFSAIKLLSRPSRSQLVEHSRGYYFRLGLMLLVIKSPKWWFRSPHALNCSLAYPLTHSLKSA
jgi:hypothetical protein